MPKPPQHLTLSVSPLGNDRVHLVLAEGTRIGALCGKVPSRRGWTVWHNRRPVTCKRCLAEMKKRGWGDD